MYPSPAGTELTQEQAQELDDTYLSSNPFEYFRSRIAALLAWQEIAPVAGEALKEASDEGVRSEFNRYLQRSAADSPFDRCDVQAQVATDALSIRHHAAEALLRLSCARLMPEPSGGAPCLWAAVATGPHQIEEVITRLNAFADGSGPGERMFQLLVPPDAREAARSNADIVDTANVFIAWLSFAMELLMPAQIDLQAANNKVKHGLAVRARSDMRLSFTTRPPDSDGSIPLSALTGDEAIDIFDQPIVEMLARGPKVDGHRQGLELSQLRLRPSAMLAQAFMLAMGHGAMFHVAAVEHFAGRMDLKEHLAPPGSPGYPIGGPRPDDIDAGAPLGLRFPLTTPPGGGPVRRVSGIGFRDYFQTFQMNYENRVSGRVVDG